MPKAQKADSPKGKKRILIVEDEHPLAHALELKLSKEGYETHIAENGNDGLVEALSGKYDLILLDLILPGIDGFAVLDGLKGKRSSVIVLSNLGQDSDRKKAEEAGALQYLVKSNVPLSEIVTVVRTHLSSSSHGHR